MSCHISVGMYSVLSPSATMPTNLLPSKKKSGRASAWPSVFSMRIATSNMVCTMFLKRWLKVKWSGVDHGFLARATNMRRISGADGVSGADGD